MKIKEKIKLKDFSHSVRATQAVLQYGVGAMVDFPEQTLMTAAPETWRESVMEIHDERLEKALRVDFFGMPGSADEARYQSGISYTRFPEWYFCPKCRKFKPLKQWIEDYNSSNNPRVKKRREKDPLMIKKLKCSTCFQDLVVARIVVACSEGHIDDFPWVKWVHAKSFEGRKKVCSKPVIKFTTSASSTEGLEGLTVSCITCNCKTTLKGAFDKDALKILDEETGGDYCFRCTGRHPWKNERISCKEYPHVLQRGGSSVYFPITISSLVIPPYSSMLTELVQKSAGYSDLRKAIHTAIKTVSALPGMTVTQEMKENIIKQNITEFARTISLEIGKKEEQVKAVLERRWNSDNDSEYSATSTKYKAEEYAALSGEVTLGDGDGEFVREALPMDEYHVPFIKKISLIHKIREVQALVAFSRLEPVDKDNLNNQKNKTTPVSIIEKGTKWYPGCEIRGEGIFIEIDDDAIDAWRSGNLEVKKRVHLLNENYKKSYYGSIKDRVVSEKFLMLHTLSHLLMKQLSFECGYNIASLKERIYCSELSEGRSMSGIFIYTASGDSEGTMGGLVRQGRPDVFPGIIKKAIENAMTCSNDPVCSLSMGQGRDSLNLSACYSCTLVPETSCEEFNVFLDRGVILGTFEKPNIGFLSSYVNRGEGCKNVRDSAQVTGTSENRESGDICIINDVGMDLSSMSYKDIWNSILQFSDNQNEIGLLNDLINHEIVMENLEKPNRNATFSIGDKHNLIVDLIWPKSKVMLFSADNEEEYHLVERTDWKSFLSCDENVSWEDIVKEIKEK